MFATPQDLANMLQAPVANTAARLALKAATARIIAETGQTFTYTEDDVVILPGGRDRILLPGQPIHLVTSVRTRALGETEWITQPAGSGYRLDAGELVWVGAWGTGGSIRPLASWSPWAWPQGVEATYTHGYLVLPDDVVGCCLQLAAEQMASPDGATFGRIDDYATRRPNIADIAGTLMLERLARRYGRGAYAVRMR